MIFKLHMIYFILIVAVFCKHQFCATLCLEKAQKLITNNNCLLWFFSRSSLYNSKALIIVFQNNSNNKHNKNFAVLYWFQLGTINTYFIQGVPYHVDNLSESNSWYKNNAILLLLKKLPLTEISLLNMEGKKWFVKDSF